MQKSVEIRSEHLWPEFRDLPRQRREAKPWILDVCPKSFLVFLNGCVLLHCDNWFPAMAWKFGCIDCAGWNCQWVPVQLVESPWGPIHGHTHALAHTHTHCGTIHKNLQHRFRKHICEGQIRWYYHWRRLAVAKAWQTFYTKTTQSTRWHFSYENFEQKMWDPLKRESADGPDTNGKACQRNCVVATAANFSKCSSGKL